jgi:hypothetical protein
MKSLCFWRIISDTPNFKPNSKRKPIPEIFSPICFCVRLIIFVAHRLATFFFSVLEGKNQKKSRTPRQEVRTPSKGGNLSFQVGDLSPKGRVGASRPDPVSGWRSDSKPLGNTNCQLNTATVFLSRDGFVCFFIFLCCFFVAFIFPCLTIF